MGLKIFMKDGNLQPRIVCDYCKRDVTCVSTGRIIYPRYDYQEGKSIKGPYFAHMGKCHDKVEELVGFGGWEHLESFIERLTNNVKYVAPENRKMVIV